jgi:mRNA (guanine-N7-)-methyltransferase
MDLGCGKGGDLKKFDFENIANYVGIDISLGQLKDAIIRKTSSQIRYPTLFIKASGEIESELLFQKIPENIYFDLVSAQFCIHYFFESEASVRRFLENVSRKLTRNGRFVATFPDSNVIMKKLLTPYKDGAMAVYDNRYVSLMMAREDLLKESPFGVKYGFFLYDKLIGHKYVEGDTTHIVYVPEYLVVLKPFISLAREYGLEVEINENFHEFYAQNIQDTSYFNLFRRMNFGIKEDSLMDSEEWDCSYLYR